MKKVIMFTVLLFILLVLGQNLCWAKVFDGQEWKKMSESFRGGYCTGIVDGTANIVNQLGGDQNEENLATV